MGKTIFTLNGRGNIFLDLMRDSFSVKSGRMFELIQDMRAETEAILLKKGIPYARLKTATREGEVYARLLEKLERAREALGGRDSVYDVLGELFQVQVMLHTALW